MKEIDRLEPRAFTRFCMSIGAVPSSYIQGLTIEEQLLWFCSYIEKEVIPAVNNNAEAVTELQNLYVQLKQYVDDYFENLDVQEEINNKLDDMAESGELAEIIAQYLESQAIIGFNTCSELAAAENLDAGSFARTMGRNTYIDGYGAFYRIRVRTNADDPDGYNLIVLTNTENLIAEKLSDKHIDDLEDFIDDEIEDNKDIMLNSDKVLFIGDSYGVGTTNETEVITSWIDYIKTRYYPTAAKYAINGAGFAAGSTTFEDLLDTAISEIEDKAAYKKIVVCGGFNDRNSSIADIKTAMSSFISKAKTNFTNAKIYVGMIGGCSLVSPTGSGYRLNTFIRSLPAYKDCNQYGAIYLNGVEQILKDYTYFSTDGYHPNADGYSKLADCIEQALQTGSYSFSTAFEGVTISDHLQANVVRNGATTTIDIEGYVEFNGVSTGPNINLGTFNSKYYRQYNTMTEPIPCRFYWTTNSSRYFGGMGYIRFDQYGNCYLDNRLYDNVNGSTNTWGSVQTGVVRLSIDYATRTLPTDLT